VPSLGSREAEQHSNDNDNGGGSSSSSSADLPFVGVVPFLTAQLRGLCLQWPAEAQAAKKATAIAQRAYDAARQRDLSDESEQWRRVAVQGGKIKQLHALLTDPSDMLEAYLHRRMTQKR
jgi:hypothetical protein